RRRESHEISYLPASSARASLTPPELGSINLGNTQASSTTRYPEEDIPDSQIPTTWVDHIASAAVREGSVTEPESDIEESQHTVVPDSQEDDLSMENYHIPQSSAVKPSTAITQQASLLPPPDDTVQSQNNIPAGGPSEYHALDAECQRLRIALEESEGKRSHLIALNMHTDRICAGLRLKNRQLDK
ncbi:hypothetical protein DXG01_013583, partial [Tephrocybe rancida]